LVVHDQVHQSVGLEVADPNGPDAALAMQVLHRPPRAMHVTKGLMDQVEVEVVEPQAAQRTVECRSGALESGVLDPELGGYEQLLARHAAASERVANRLCVLVGGRRINEPI